MANDTATAAETAKASCGSEKLKLSEFVGMSIRNIRADYGDVLNIPSDATALVNGKAKEETYELKGKDDLVFSRPVGQKG